MRGSPTGSIRSEVSLARRSGAEPVTPPGGPQRHACTAPYRSSASVFARASSARRDAVERTKLVKPPQPGRPPETIGRGQPNAQAQRTRTAKRDMIAEKAPRRCGVRCSARLGGGYSSRFRRLGEAPVCHGFGTPTPCRAMSLDVGRGGWVMTCRAHGVGVTEPVAHGTQAEWAISRIESCTLRRGPTVTTECGWTTPRKASVLPTVAERSRSRWYASPFGGSLADLRLR